MAKINFTTKIIIVVIVVVLIGIMTYYFTKVEGFDNKESCALLRKNHKIVVKTMDAIPQDSADTRNAINNGLNFRDMQMRDIILGDDKNSWCDKLTSKELQEVQQAMAEEVGTDVQLFDGGDIMDRDEAQSMAEGIAYNGGSDYASVNAPMSVLS